MLTSAQAPVEARSFHDRIYAGDILHFADMPQMREITAFTREFVENHLHPHIPTEIHLHLGGPDAVERIRACVRDYGRSEETKARWLAFFEALGFDPAKIARDRFLLRFQPHHRPDAPTPRARGVSTVAFHRDTWGTNLYSQVNWWAPVYPITAGRTVGFYPTLWDRPLANSSAGFDIGKAIAGNRRDGKSEPVEMIPQLTEDISGEPLQPLVIDPGTIIAFSGAHAHAGVPNHTGVTRISLETRTVWIEDQVSGRGTPNIDGYSPLMSPGLFRRLSDGTKFEQILGVQAVAPYARPDVDRPETALNLSSEG